MQPRQALPIWDNYALINTLVSYTIKSASPFAMDTNHLRTPYHGYQYFTKRRTIVRHLASGRNNRMLQSFYANYSTPVQRFVGLLRVKEHCSAPYGVCTYRTGDAHFYLKFKSYDFNGDCSGTVQSPVGRRTRSEKHQEISKYLLNKSADAHLGTER